MNSNRLSRIYYTSNLFENRRQIVVKLLIPKAQYEIALRGQPVGSRRVVTLRLLSGVFGPVKLNNQLCGKANEVDTVWAKGNLPTKLMTVKLLRAESAPKPLFRFRHVVAELAGKLSLVGVAVHRADYPLPNPPLKREGTGGFIEWWNGSGE